MKAKKFYVEPHFEVVKIATAQMLCTSDFDDGQGGSGSEEGEGL